MSVVPVPRPPTILIDDHLEWLHRLATEVKLALNAASIWSFFPRAETAENSNIVDVHIDNPVTSAVGLRVRYTAGPQHESRVVISRSETKIFLEARCISGDRRHEENCSFDWQHSGMEKSIQRAVGIMMEFFKEPIYQDPHKR